MKNEEIINKINEIKKDYLLEVNSWTTLGGLANSSGTIITTNKKVFNYSLFYNQNEALKENASSYIKEVGTLDDNQYNSFITFINTEELLNKSFESIKLNEAGFIISVKLNNQENIITNCISFNPKNPKIYDKILILMNSILGQ